MVAAPFAYTSVDNSNVYRPEPRLIALNLQTGVEPLPTQLFRACVEEHKAEIAALQILDSRPCARRLTEDMLKELEAKLKQDPTIGPDPVTTIWRAFEQAQTGVTENTAPKPENTGQSQASVLSVSVL